MLSNFTSHLPAYPSLRRLPPLPPTVDIQLTSEPAPPADVPSPRQLTSPAHPAQWDDSFPKTELRPHRHHQHHAGAPGQPARHEPRIQHAMNPGSSAFW